jgi:hypothetical protein
MTSRTPIADKIRELLASAATPEEIVAAVETHEEAAAAAQKPRQLSLIDQADTKRGARLPKSWHPSGRDIGFAQSRGMTNAQFEAESEKFRNYWTAKSGASATKLDWEATWRNWIINTLERQNEYRRNGGSRSDSSAGRGPTGANAVLAGMGRLARRFDEERDAKGQRRQISRDPDAAS